MKRIITLLVLALLAGGLLYGTFVMREQPAETGAGGEKLLPELDAKINAASRISLRTNEAPITVSRGEDGWQVTSQYDYPADIAKVRQWLIGLARLEKVEPKTRKPEYYANLGLQEPGSETAESVGVKVTASEGEVLADVILGERRSVSGRSGPTEIYARLADDPQTWLTRGHLPPADQPNSWLERELLSLEIGAITRIHIEQADGATVRIEPQGAQGPLIWASLPDEAEAAASPTPQQVANRFSQLRLDNVRPAADIAEAERDFTVTVSRRDGLVITLTGYLFEDEDWVTLAAKYDPEERQEDAQAAKEDDAAEANAEAGKPKAPAAESGHEPSLASPADVKEEATTLNARWSGWAYYLPPYILNDIDLVPADIIKQADDQAGEKTSAADGQAAAPAEMPAGVADMLEQRGLSSEAE